MFTKIFPNTTKQELSKTREETHKTSTVNWEHAKHKSNIKICS